MRSNGMGGGRRHRWWVRLCTRRSIPVAKAIATAARERLGILQPVESFINREGLGVQGVIAGRAVIAVALHDSARQNREAEK